MHGNLPLPVARLAVWSAVLGLGILLVSFGLAYFLATLYRAEPLPAALAFLTLAFLPRGLRGAVLLALGCAAVSLALVRLIGGSLTAAASQR